MKTLLLIAVLLMAGIFTEKSIANPVAVNDTSAKINHVQDGNINEWRIEKFETDKDTHILYCIDHDMNNLYLAMKINDQRTQLKLMTHGMNLYIDKKGRKREGTGIEFPVKNEGSGFEGREGKQPDPKEIRERLAATMILLRSFGFEDQDDKTQLIASETGVNIAFDWDTANNMYIEYQVPLKFIGPQAALNGKTLGIGWKINGISAPPSGASTGASSFGQAGNGFGGGGGRGGGGRVAGSGSSVAKVTFGPNLSDSRFQEQSIWTKYIISF